MTRADIVFEVELECRRQIQLQAEGRFQHTLQSPAISHVERLAVVAEEFGEVAREIAEQIAGRGLDRDNLRAELIQLAACCVAWVEQIDGALAEQYAAPEIPSDPPVPFIPRSSELPSYLPAAEAEAEAEAAWRLIPDFGGAL